MHTGEIAGLTFEGQVMSIDAAAGIQPNFNVLIDSGSQRDTKGMYLVNVSFRRPGL